MVGFFGQWCGDLPMIFTHECVTHDNHWQITPLMIKKIVTHGTQYIIIYTVNSLI